MKSGAQQITNLQLELVKLFSYDLPDTQLKEIRKLLADYFAEKASDEMDKVWIEKNWTNKSIELLSKKHLRSTYK